MEARSLLEVERKRAVARKYLFAEPTSVRMWAIMNSLLTPSYLHLAVRHGIMIVYQANTEPQARRLAEHLQSRGVEVVVRSAAEHNVLSTTITNTGVVTLVLESWRDFGPAMQRNYKMAMLLGKVLLVVVRDLKNLPNLLFDLPPLVWGQSYDCLLHTIEELFISRISEDDPYVEKA